MSVPESVLVLVLVPVLWVAAEAAGMGALERMVEELLSEADPLGRPLRYRKQRGLDVVALPKARWDLTQGDCGQGRLGSCGRSAPGSNEGGIRRAFHIS